MFDAFRKSSGSLFRATTLVTALTSAFLPAAATAQQTNFAPSNGSAPVATKVTREPTVRVAGADTPFKIADVRGQGSGFGIAVAGDTVKKNYLVLVARGEDQKLMDMAENIMKGIYRSGRQRILMVQSDGESNVMDVVVPGKGSILDTADASGLTAAVTRDEIIKMYDQYVAKPTVEQSLALNKQ